MPSRSLAAFDSGVSLAKALCDIESTFPDPPDSTIPMQTESVEGLRAGALVLMVAAFERFIRDAISEHASHLTNSPPKTAFHMLPEKLQAASVFKSLRHAMDGPRHGKRSGKLSRLPEIKRAAQFIVDGTPDITALSITGGNVDSDTVGDLLRDLGISDPFSAMRMAFDNAWKSPESIQFVYDKLNEIVSKRNQIAHFASALNLSRLEILTYIRFLRACAFAIDELAASHLGQY